jgi:hypothetical protein
MFIEMDANSNGTVTKEEFINYLRSRPQLQNIMYEGLVAGEQDKLPCERISPQQLRAMGIKRIVKVYKDMDVNKNGVLCWEEFLGFFQRTGLLLSYTTPDNPRDRMADVLGSEYQHRQVVAKWQKGGAAIGVGKEAGWERLAEELHSKLHSKFLIDQKQAELNTQWAAEKLVQLKDQNAKGRDALSIVAESVDALKEAKEATKTFGRPVRRRFPAQHGSVSQTPRTASQTPETLDTERRRADSQRSLSTVSSTSGARPSTPAPTCTPEYSPREAFRSRAFKYSFKTFDAETAESKTPEPEKVVAERNCAKPVPSNEPYAEPEWSAYPVLNSTKTSQLPPMQIPWVLKQPPQMTCNSPMRKKQRSHSSMSPKKRQQTSPKRSQSFRRTKSGRAVSPTKRGQTPRHQVEKPVLVDQSWFALDN